MKSLAELAAIREKMKNKVAMREGENTIRVSIGMATCGIAAGARPVLNAFVEKVTEIKAYVVKEELQEITLKLGELTDDEREIILKGCLINYNRA